ncbi:tetratricopeptide repeat protein [Arenibacter sp. GZD96]|uniref:tetratricopeptide repeat-containing sensor histidine kinase n=1 Tax=Aurantibrevibacter litoralis TaxID=3106030 RepID=UPI002AFE033F|nr:tetratricopeptide repeat protein [Arenibacter sp. GZD-96]MEA1786610.1 tetratricopeptide repeat protein [Arenibacter sp. GZD-96]
MKFLNTKNGIHATARGIRNSLFLLCLLSVFQGTSQEVSSLFKSRVDSLIAAAPNTYMEIDAVCRAVRRDTIYMRYFNEISAERSYRAGQAYALNQMGTKYRDISQYAKAGALHRQALEIAIEADNVEFRVFSLNMLGVVYRRSDAIKIALDYSQEALELAESVENPTEGIKRSINVALNSIGNIYQTLEQYDLAIAQFTKSMKLEEELGNTLGLAINHQNVGECFEAKGLLEDALENYRISLAYNEEINSDKGKIICKNSIAKVYIKQNKLEDALEILEPALLSAELLGDMQIAAAVQINLGWVLMRLGRFSEADKELEAGLALAKKYNLPTFISEAYSLLSNLASEQNAYKEALDYYRESIKINQSISNDRNLRYVNDMIIRYDSEKKNNQIAVLAKENEIVKLKLRRNQNTFLVAGLALCLVGFILYILYRQAQLGNEKKLLTLEQTMLRSQMNPHFLFNSLNSIKLYIINNEQKNAVHYLNKFSKLVRKILEASSMREIPLAEELETVTLYMNIENIRFNNEINFNVAVDDDIQVHQIKIPSLILQPFLENALWHGLSSKEGEKKIELHIYRSKNGFITIAITDNGIGRACAEKIKEGKVLKRKSMGIDITKERLANFSKDFQNSFQVAIMDNFDDHQVPSGTTVLLHIPTF